MKLPKTRHSHWTSSGLVSLIVFVATALTKIPERPTCLLKTFWLLLSAELLRAQIYVQYFKMIKIIA